MVDKTPNPIVMVIISAAVGAIIGWLLRDIFPKILNKIKLTIQVHREKLETEKNAVFNRLDPRPIYIHPKGYGCYMDNPKKTPAFCGKCYSPNSDLTHLEHVKGGKYVCPVCKTEYKH